jgi:integrase
MPKNLWKPKGSPYWYWEVVWKGRRFHGPTGETSLRRAEAVKDAEILAIKTGSGKRQASLDMVALDYWEKTGQFAAGAAADEENLHWLITTLGPERGIQEIEEPELLDALARRRAEGNRRRKVHTPLSNATLNRIVPELFKRLHNHARRGMKVEVAEIDWPQLKLEEADELVRELTPAQEQRLLGAIRFDLVPLVRFSLATGLRQANAIALTRFQCDLEGGFIRLQVKSKKPGGKRVTMEISPSTAALLANEMALHDHPQVFTYHPHDCAGRPIEGAARRPMTKNIIENQWPRALAAAEIEDFRWHDLRHTFASRFTRLKGIRAAQKALSHSDPKTTAKYAHVSEAEIREGLDQLDALSAQDAGQPQNSPKANREGFTKRRNK